MHKKSIVMLLSGLLIVLTLGAAQAQTATPFQPIPPDQQAQYHFNYEKAFFASPAAFDAAVRSLDTQVKDIQSLRGKVTASPQNLYRALKESDDFSVTFSLIYAYLTLKYSTNNKDVADRDKATELDARLSPQLSFVNDEVQKIAPATLQKYLAVYPSLRPYQYAIEESVRFRPHTLSLPEEELLAKTEPLLTSWSEDEYDLLLDRASWGKVHDPAQGDLDVRQDAAKIGNSTERTVRQAGFDQSNAAYAAQRDLVAFDLIHRVKTANALAKLRHFKNSEDARFFNIHLGYADVENAYAQILAHGTLRKRLQVLQRDRIQAFTGYDVIHTYDTSVVPPGVEKPRFTINEAVATIKASTAYLGPAWNGQLDSLLDPANGRLDIVGGPDRAAGAFTYTLPNHDSPFFSYGYEGYLQDVSTLAHESGHAVHQGLMNAAHIPPSNMDGPSYFTESYAILDEFVLADSLYQKETNPGRKVYYLEALLNQMMSFYGNTQIAALEKGIYEGVDNGTIKTPDDLDALTYKLGSQVSIYYDIDPVRKNLWEVVPHFYRNGTPYENYVFADLLAQTYFAMYKKDPAAFARRFTALEANGFNDTPKNLLQKFLGIDISAPSTYNAVFAQQERYVNELTQLYQQVPVTPMTRK